MIHSFVLNFDANTGKPVMTGTGAFSVRLTCQTWQLQLTGLTCQLEGCQSFWQSFSPVFAYHFSRCETGVE
jgi:hypothetical protein